LVLLPTPLSLLDPLACAALVAAPGQSQCRAHDYDFLFHIISFSFGYSDLLFSLLYTQTPTCSLQTRYNPDFACRTPPCSSIDFQAFTHLRTYRRMQG